MTYKEKVKMGGLSFIEYLTVAVPKNVISRAGFDPKELEDFERVTGILKTRRYEGTTSKMIINAIDACGFCGEDIEGIIVVTQSPDRLSPCLAVDVHAHLSLRSRVPAIDINHACDGWVMGLHVARTFSEKTLLICADRLRYDKTPLEGLIFSDSVSITIVKGGDPAPVEFFTDGTKVSKLYCGLDGAMDMDGSFVFDFVTTRVPSMIKNFRAKHPCARLVPHQANLSMNKILASRSEFKDRWLESIREYGNQSMNSIPTAIAVNESEVHGEALLLCGFGAGMTVSMMKVVWPQHEVAWLVEI